MLDNEHPVNPGDQGGEPDGVSTPSDETAETTTTPARRTRATRRKAAAPPPEPPLDTSGAVSGDDAGVVAVGRASVPSAADASAGSAAGGGDADAEVPTRPVKAARSRRKATAPAAAPAASTEGAAAETGTDGEGAAAAAEKPVKATRSRRKKAAPAAVPAVADEVPPADQPLVEQTTPPTPVEPVAVDLPAAERVAAAEAMAAEEAEAEEDEEEAAESAPIVAVIPLDDDFVEEQPTSRTRSRRAALPPAVLFMPPDPAEAEAAAPVSRRRRRGAAVEEAPAEVETPAEAPVAEAAEPVEATRRSRRRRRGAAVEDPIEAEAVDTVETEEEPVDEADESADDVEEGIDDDSEDDLAGARRRRRRGRRGRGRGKGPADDIEGEEADDVVAVSEGEAESESEEDEESDEGDGVTRRRRRRRRKGSSGDGETGGIEDGVHTVVRVREPRRTDEVQGVSGSTRLEAKRQRRRDGREQRRTRPPILSESEFLARREAVDRVMVVRQKPDRTQIAVLEDGILVEHYVSRTTSGTMVGNVYLGKVQNVLPSMEAAFVDVGRGRNAVLYAGEVNWDATGLEGRARSIEQALRSGDSVLVQVTKDPIGHKGARLSSHIALSGRHLVYVPNGNASGISRKLPDNERKRLRDILKKLVPDGAGVIVRTAAEGASEDELARDVKRLQSQWEEIQRRAAEGHAPAALSEEPDLVIRVVRDLFNEDFRELIVQGEQAYGELENYLNSVSPDLVERMHRHVGVDDVFAEKRIDEQILKGLDRKVFLPSGGHLVIDRTEAMTVVDVNTGKYTGAGGNLEETVTRNNLEAAEEIVRQLRLRDLGGIVVIDFIDMVLESNRELVLRRLTECLGRDRTKHQVTEITSLGLVQMTRKRIGAGLLEAFSETCDHCKGRGVMIHTEPVPEKRSNGVAATQVKAVAAAPRIEQQQPAAAAPVATSGRSRRRRGGGTEQVETPVEARVEPQVESQIETPIEEPVEVIETRHDGENPLAIAADLPPVLGSGIVSAAAKAALTKNDNADEYDISGYDLSRYDSPAFEEPAFEEPAFEEAAFEEPDEPEEEREPLRLVGSDDPDAAEDDEEEDDEAVGAGAGNRRRSRRSGTRRRTRP
jgi:ribonuclease E